MRYPLGCRTVKSAIDLRCRGTICYPAMRLAIRRAAMTADKEDPQVQRDFDRKKVIFEQDCQEFRSLNGFLWQVPVLVSTLTGGLWFGADKVATGSVVRPALWLLSCCVNLVFVAVLWRLRAGPMEALLGRIHAYQDVPRSGGKYTMICMFTFLLVLSAVISLVALFYDLGFFKFIARCWT
jgi:hypothetical protein